MGCNGYVWEGGCLWCTVLNEDVELLMGRMGVTIVGRLASWGFWYTWVMGFGDERGGLMGEGRERGKAVSYVRRDMPDRALGLPPLCVYPSVC